MSTSALDEFIRLPMEEAVQAYFDRLNTSVLRRALAVLSAGAVVGIIGFLSQADYLRAGLWALLLVVTAVLLLVRETRFYVRNARLLLLTTIVVVLLVVVQSFQQPEPGFTFSGFVFPASLIFFRMRGREYMTLTAIFCATAAWFVIGQSMVESTGDRIGLILSQTTVAAVCWTLATRATRNRRNEFLIDWRREIARDRESRRMRSELHDAREIQLSMLPKTAPQLDWLDYSSISLPASEVGGDYFEYFVLSDTRLVVAIGDVAGHGVASGLVLSGVRSGLHLLRDQLTEPLKVLDRLNRMVRETAPVRMFVTLQLAVLDYEVGRLTVANAGHPPLLRLASAKSTVDRLGGPGLPLGTGLEPGLTQLSEPMKTGDTLLFYTDGATEIRDLRSEQFGDTRLAGELQRSQRGTARHTRDALLNSLSSFKADVMQEDDLTLLVLKIR